MQNNNRLSNIELLRLVSMFLVMFFHVTDAISQKNNIAENSIDDIMLATFSSLSIICVDIFILISGYFGITFKMKGVIKLFFQIFFLSLLIYGILCIIGYATFNIKPQFRSIILCDLLLYIDVTFWFLSIDLGFFWGSCIGIKSPTQTQWGDMISTKKYCLFNEDLRVVCFICI